MERIWTRRGVLAAFGSVTIAGCLSDTPLDGSDSANADDEESDDDSTNADSDGGAEAPDPPETVESEWLMPGHDPGQTSYAPDATGPADDVAQLWKRETDSSLSAPVVADGTLFVGTGDGAVRALDAATGDSQWEQSVDAQARTPWIFDDSLYVPTNEELVALDMTGDERWRADLSSQQTLLVTAHGVYVLAGHQSATVTMLAHADGSEQWTTDIHDPWTSHMFADEDHIYISTAGYNPDPWTIDAETGEVVGDEPTRGADFPSGVFALDGTVYAFEGFFGSVHGDDWSQGVPAAGESRSHHGMCAGDEHVYLAASYGEEPGLYALDRTDGQQSWSVSFENLAGGPIATSETVLVNTGETLFCFDAAEGTELWTLQGGEISDRFAVADDIVYTTSERTLRAYRPT